MTNVSTEIPDHLAADVQRALDHFNRIEDIDFKVTGIIDAEQIDLNQTDREVKLILCGEDRCEQHTFRFAADGAPALVGKTVDREGIATLDPPPGALEG